MEARIASGVFYKYLANVPGKKSYTVPDGVEEIAEYAFCWGKELEEVILSDSVKKIGSGAFAGCTALKRVRLPDGLKWLYGATFNRCESLERIELPASLQEIGSGAFQGCVSLREVVFPQGLEEIDSSAFSGCRGLERIEFPQGLKEIGSCAFSDCRSLEQIELPPEAKILSSAFSGCTLREVFVPNGVLLDSMAFRKMPDLERIVIDGDNIFRITPYISEIVKEQMEEPTSFFADCPKLREIIFTEKAKIYYNQNGLVLKRNGDLVKVPQACPDPVVAVPEGVRRIYLHAFDACTGIKKIKLPTSLQGLSREHFETCISLSDFEVADGNEYLSVRDGIVYDRDRKKVLLAVVPPEDLVLPDTVISIADHAFEKTSLKHIVLPASLRSIGDCAFKDTPLLTELVLPSSVREIGEQAFNSAGIQRLVISEGVERIGSYAFSRTRIERLDIPAGVKNIGVYAFENCKNLREVRVFAEPKEFLWGAFAQCNALERLYLAGSADGFLLNEFPEKADCVIIAPKVKLPTMPVPIKAKLASGFAAAYEAGETEKGWPRDEYLRYIRSQRKRLFPLALRRQALLRLMLAQKMLRPDDIKELLQNEKCDAEAKAALLEYKSANFPNSDTDELFAQMRAMERAASGQKTVEDFKKEWTFGKRQDGTIIIRSYKGSGPVAEIPERIGKTLVTEIGENLLAAATEKHISVRRVLVPASVRKIAVTAFEGCTELEEIVVHPENTVYRSEGGGLYQGNVLLRVPRGRQGSIAVAEGTVDIAPGALRGCCLEEIVLPATVRSIGERAFEDCEKLRAVAIPAACKVKEWAFKGCRALSQISIGQGAVIDDYAFHALRRKS